MRSGAIPHQLAIPLAGVVGLFVGSFLNVVIYRTPLGLSVATPRSFCPTCNRQLTWWENVPVASWVALRGRCRTCRRPISPSYPLVELATGVVFALVTWGWHGTIVSAAYCALGASMIVVSLIEYGGQRAPLSIAAIGTAVALGIILVGSGWQHDWGIIGGSLLGASLGMVCLALLRVRDPNCLDPRGFGRSAILIAGCWLGGLGLSAATFGAGAWIVAYLVCMLGAWSETRQSSGANASVIASVRNAGPLLRIPLVSAIAVAMAASLIAAG
jgi:leader peptidase (prepilin peptidase)/N-methyltransferase